MKKIRLLLVDDQKHYIRSLASVISNRAREIEVVGMAENGLEALKIIDDVQPSIILMDVRMPKMDGVECTKIVTRNYPDIKIMMFSTFDDDEYIFEAVENGAIGYILKNTPPGELITSIRAINGGVFQMSPSIARKLVKTQSRNLAKKPLMDETAVPEWFSSLRIREREVLLLLSQGYSNKEIGERLFIAEQTVKNYTSHIYDVMGAENRFCAQKMVLEAGFLNP